MKFQYKVIQEMGKKKKEHLHLSQKLVKQHLLVKTASFITSLHSGQ